jgi:hypothetical protein
MGITVVSYTLKDIRDDEGYLKVYQNANSFKQYLKVNMNSRLWDLQGQRKSREMQELEKRKREEMPP